jgi:uncharacterized protein YggE
MKNILLLAACLGTACALADGLPTTPYVYVQGYAEEQVVPDTLTVGFSATATDKDQVRAKALVAEKSAAVFKLLQSLAISDESVAAHDISVTENFDYDAGKRSFTGYAVTRNFTVKLTDFQAYPKLVDGLIGLRIENMNGAQPSYAKSADATVRLKKAALAQARRQAEDLAAGMNARITGVFAASPIAFGEIPRAIFGGSSGGPEPMASNLIVRSQKEGTEDKYVFEKLTLSERLHVIFLVEPGRP